MGFLQGEGGVITDVAQADEEDGDFGGLVWHIDWVVHVGVPGGMGRI